MSKIASAQNSKTTVNSKTSVVSGEVEDASVKSDFIYGGPFIGQPKKDIFLNTTTPINICLQGTYKRSFAHYSIKERLPVILTRVIDTLSRERSATGGSDDDVKKAIAYISQLKNEVITNKKYVLLTVDSKEAKLWNKWIENCDPKDYFTSTWLFTECYVYRRLREAFELQPKLSNYDPFFTQKTSAFASSLEPMCVIATKLEQMENAEKDQLKQNFVTLLKLSLWSNKCDLSLTLGSVPESVADPIKLITDLKDKLLVDDTSKIVDQVLSKAEAMQKNIDNKTTFKEQCSCIRLAGGVKPEPPPVDPANPEEKKEIPCPSKMTMPSVVIFDIVCDNAGYELFTDLCIAHFLIAKDIVKKVRFHVKKIPWFVSDVTPKDFRYVITECTKASFRKEVPASVPADAGENAEPPAPLVITAEALNKLGAQWLAFVENGTFVVIADDFWTSPHPYKDMKKHDPMLYRKLQFAVGIIFKGDLNYRKLLGEKRWNPVNGFENSLQGFMPAPVIAIRTVKSELICGLPKGKAEQINKIDEKWMEKGDYG